MNEALQLFPAYVTTTHYTELYGTWDNDISFAFRQFAEYEVIFHFLEREQGSTLPG